MEEKILNEWNRWNTQKLDDEDLITELNNIKESETEIFDRFYRNLEFGTGGLRGVIGVGTNRMNIYTVAKATQGYSNYLKKQTASPSVAIAYDSRIKSDVFAKVAAEVFAANGVRVYIYPELMPTPSLSFAVRHLKCSGGIVITASHNPSKYNGYKVYGCDGCQITTEAAASILAEIEAVDIFKAVKNCSFEEALAQGKVTYIGDQVVREYLNAVSSQTLCEDETDKGFSIVYTPLNGAGLKCVTQVLKENGFTNISVVKEQEKPDGRFLTCPYPNPEIREALELGLRDAKELGSDLLLATDPDCDRVGIAVRSNEDYVLLSGNEVGMLLLDYICKRRIALNKMPKNPILVKTIVTIDMANRIAEDYGVQVIDVLTGFKFIGEQIGLLEAKGEEERFIFGFEESYGYLTGGYVRDKDAVDGSLMICEMFAYYKNQGLSMIDVLNDLYQRYGYCLNTLHSYTFEGAEGFQKMQMIMQELRKTSLKEIAGRKVIEVRDYLEGINQLPKSDVLKYMLESNTSIVIRPSGTEPKLKVYLSVSADNHDAAEKMEAFIVNELEERFK
ncbi:phospho-sugar mutase [Clostridium sp. WB02_MRS01]|uniref:phospho-sugar mutase n=1 Tax=Clostridium sp. WB02_MRS01 TaxID=2605777 RepID=UPI0012B3CAD1|nr:phospho-sugar mutase [Clostridium sp. WB02_MRS01]MSS10787.1 phospho-sugar mutase [Clostridium sp. WB02_MRS01]